MAGVPIALLSDQTGSNVLDLSTAAPTSVLPATAAVVTKYDPSRRAPASVAEIKGRFNPAYKACPPTADQTDGLKALANRFVTEKRTGQFLVADVGAGKTATTGWLYTYLRINQKLRPGIALIFCPKNCIDQWSDEMMAKCG